MKKYAALLVLALLLAFPASSGAFCYHAPIVAASSGGAASPALLPFATAVSFGAFLIYANATGIDFPLCGHDWLNHPDALGVFGENCFSEYPTGVNGASQ